MAKRMQEQQREERIVAKSKPTLNLTSPASSNSSTVQSPIAPKSLGILKSPCHPDWTGTGRPGAREFNQEEPASSSQAWQKNAVLDVSRRRLAATEKDQEHLNFPEDSKSTRRLVASGNSDTNGKDRTWPQNLHTAVCVPHIEKVFSIVRQKIWSQSERENGKPRCERSCLEYIYVRDSSSCSSSWDRLHGEFAFYQESVQEIIETVVSSDSEADH